MKSVFCKRRLILNTIRVIHRFEKLLERVENTKVNPLVNDIVFDGACLTPELELYIKKIISLFPDASLERRHCTQISVLPPLWHGEGSTFNEPIFVSNLKEAEDKYSLVCGGADYRGNPYLQTIKLYKFPDYIDSRVAKVFLIYATIHEYAHTISRASYYWEEFAFNYLRIVNPEKPMYNLKIKGRNFDPKKWQDEFLAIALTYPPITNYSAIYKDEEAGNLRHHEYMAEYITTYLMGIAMNLKMLERWCGLGDRPELESKIKEFLEAKANIKYV